MWMDADVVIVQIMFDGEDDDDDERVRTARTNDKRRARVSGGGLWTLSLRRHYAATTPLSSCLHLLFFLLLYYIPLYSVSLISFLYHSPKYPRIAGCPDSPQDGGRYG